jgi:glutathione S-transferase
MYRGTYTLVGQELSMFTRKLEAQLRYQAIPYQWRYKTLEQAQAIEARAGTRFVPLLETPDGWVLNDTIAIGPMLHERFSETPVIPAAPAQRGACFVLEDFFNHWFPRHALHTRWCYPHNVAAAGRNFGINLLLGKSIDSVLSEAEEQQVAGTGQMMLDAFGAMACEVQGAGPGQKAAVQADFHRIMDMLGDHFEEHNFLLGERACLADFALLGPSLAHFLLDPEPRSWLGKRVPMLEAYVERVWAGSGSDSKWLAQDEIPESLNPLFEHVRKTYQRFAASSIEAADRGEKFFTLDLGDGPFTARSMKRLNKVRQHVGDELQRCNAQDSALQSRGVMDFYLK